MEDVNKKHGFISFRKKSWISGVPEDTRKECGSIFDKTMSQLMKLDGNNKVSIILNPMQPMQADAILAAFETFQELKGRGLGDVNYLRDSWNITSTQGKKYFVDVSLDGTTAYPEGV